MKQRCGNPDQKGCDFRDHDGLDSINCGKGPGSKPNPQQGESDTAWVEPIARDSVGTFPTVRQSLRLHPDPRITLGE